MERMLLTVTDVAGQLGVSKSKVYQFIQSGALVSVMLGGSRRVRSRDLEAFVDGLSSRWVA